MTSATGAICAKVEELRSQGIKIYNFAKGDPVLPNHPILIEAARQALQEGFSPYAPIAGLMDLRKAAADWMNRRYGCSISPDETVVTTGGKFGIYASLQVLLNEGDEVLIASPYWVSYPEMIRLAKGKAVIVETWKWTPELLQKALTDKTRVLILNNGCNPTGILYTSEELNALLTLAMKANLWVISDEVYSELVFEGKYISCSSFPQYRSKIIIIESCSKNFAMAGWRVGFAFGPKKLIEEIIALQSQSTTGTSFLSQKVALAAMENSETISSYVREAMRQRRKIFFETLSRLTETKITPPPAGLYYFTKMDPLFEKANVALVPGEAFGIKGYTRFSFAEQEENLIEGLESLFSKVCENSLDKK